MNKKELIKLVSTSTCITKKDVELVLKSILEAIVLTVANGETVRLVGFGVFYAYPKRVENISYNTTLKIIKFSTGKFFRRSVCGKI